jgi:hypothetical protein
MHTKCLQQVAVIWLLLLAFSALAIAQARVEKNVVYGMYSGTALLLDVHYPARPNGFGIMFIPGSGWGAPLGYSARPLKESDQVGMYVPTLTQAGYTVFTITHRATPTFRYPAAIEDVQRAARFIRPRRPHMASIRIISVARADRPAATWSACSALWMAPAIRTIPTRSIAKAPSSSASSPALRPSICSTMVQPHCPCSWERP